MRRDETDTSMEQTDENTRDANRGAWLGRRAAFALAVTTLLMAGATMFAGQHRRGGHKLRLAVVGIAIAGLLIAFQMTIVAAASRISLYPAIYVLVVLPALVSLGVLHVSDRYAAGREPWARWLVRRRTSGRLASSH